ncbi:hypothetical protein PVAP13_1NG419319 [Panicum virgatum]|uniref:Uncharacterized protein n=1 Tax=Panicum virgatum TaxID=38727 RepID=A0A8T0X581_PANVG|nr:hypothetical protein PVAP13_1NG419319 [Panicum virgatum]
MGGRKAPASPSTGHEPNRPARRRPRRSRGAISAFPRPETSAPGLFGRPRARLEFGRWVGGPAGQVASRHACGAGERCRGRGAHDEPRHVRTYSPRPRLGGSIDLQPETAARPASGSVRAPYSDPAAGWPSCLLPNSRRRVTGRG